MASPSPSIVPSEWLEKGRQSPVGDMAVTVLKHMNILMSLQASTPPVITTSDLPRYNSLSPTSKAARELAQAASMTQFVPPRSKRLAIRPAMTFPRSPGKVFSCHGV